MWSPFEQKVIREDIFRWLEYQELQLGGYEFQRAFMRSAYSYRGVRISLMDRQVGIWNPEGFSTTLSITSTLDSPYVDEGDDVIRRYKYEDSKYFGQGRNIKLRAAIESEDPLIYFEEVRPTYYIARYPVFVVGEDRSAGYFHVALDQAFTIFGDPMDLSAEERSYAEHVVRARLHQPKFRARVLHAYSERCAVCSLAHRELLDAAHIIPDAAKHSSTSVTNGLALCKIHHAAYDRDFLGISPNYRIEINRRLLDEVDGPMLRHGLQDMHGQPLRIEHVRMNDRPDPELLEERFEQFRAA